MTKSAQLTENKAEVANGEWVGNPKKGYTLRGVAKERKAAGPKRFAGDSGGEK